MSAVVIEFAKKALQRGDINQRTEEVAALIIAKAYQEACNTFEIDPERPFHELDLDTQDCITLERDTALNAAAAHLMEAGGPSDIETAAKLLVHCSFG